jgi:hypothetical protein
MEDHVMKEYIPAYGIRLAALAFCKRTQDKSASNSRRKKTLVERIRNKMKRTHYGNKGDEHDEKCGTPTSTGVGNKYAAKLTKRVELGWLDYDFASKSYKQVRTKKSGGTRHINVEKGTTMPEILEAAKRLFFPEGSNTKGDVDSFVFDISDFSGEEIDIPDLTLDQMYSKTGFKIMRLYMRTKRIVKAETDETSESNDADSDGIPVLHPPTNRRKALSQPIPQESMEADRSAGGSQDTDSLGIPLTTSVQDLTTSDVTVETESSSSKDTGSIPQRDQITSEISVETESSLSKDTDTIQQRDTSMPTSEQSFTVTVSQHIDVDDTDKGEMFTDLPVDTPDEVEDLMQIPIVDLASPNSVEDLRVRRGHVLEDLINAFAQNPGLVTADLKIEMVSLLGNVEEAKGAGILRDCLTEFLGTFYEKCTLGTDIKVPLIRHDYGDAEWSAIARILEKGFEVGYFPILLAQPFLEEALYGYSESDMCTAFLSYVSVYERDLFKAALQDLGSVDEDELLDALDNYGCKVKPTEGSLREILGQLGHKELIQAPMYIRKCWRPILRTLAVGIPQPSLHEAISNRHPTNKTVLASLVFKQELIGNRSNVAKYLKRYVREVDHNGLCKFLRFCTGADQMNGNIEVNFVKMTDFECRPTSNTCSNLLNVSDSYPSMPQLRSDFNYVFASADWSMDYV